MAGEKLDPPPDPLMPFPRFGTCELCKWWERANPESARGYCRRYAPRAIMFPEKDFPEDDPSNQYAFFPVTLAKEWCGEQEARTS